MSASLRDQLELMLSADLVLQWKLARKATSCFYEPAGDDAHRNENTMRRLCVGVFYWNWCFSNIRPSLPVGFPRRANDRARATDPWVRLARMFVRRCGWTFAIRGSLCRHSFRPVVNHCSAAGQVGVCLILSKLAFENFAFRVNERTASCGGVKPIEVASFAPWLKERT